MGLISWHYFVPYQRDIAQALRQLREQVFASGAYYNRRSEFAEELAHLRSIGDVTYQSYIVMRLIFAIGVLSHVLIRWHFSPILPIAVIVPA